MTTKYVKCIMCGRFLSKSERNSFRTFYNSFGYKTIGNVCNYCVEGSKPPRSKKQKEASEKNFILYKLSGILSQIDKLSREDCFDTVDKKLLLSAKDNINIVLKGKNDWKKSKHKNNETVIKIKKDWQFILDKNKMIDF